MLECVLERERSALQICALLNGFVDLEPTLAAVEAQLRALSSCQTVAICLAREGCLPLGDLSGPLGCICMPVPDGGLPFLCEEVMSGADSFFCGRLSEALGSAALPPSEPALCSEAGLETLAVVPIHTGGEVVGLVLLADSSASSFDEDLMRTLEMVSDQIGVAVGNSRDHAVLMSAENRARESESRLRTLFDAMGEALALYEIMPDDEGVPADFRFLDVNRSYELMTSLKRECLIGEPLSQAGHHVEPNILDRYRRAAQTGEEERFTAFSEALQRWLSFVVNRTQSGQLVVLFSDITERKRADEAVLRLSMYDTLTGVYNRHFMEKEMYRLETSDVTPCGVILGDLNGLKLTNDAVGHGSGDDLLRRCASILSECADNRATVGRWGGDEFLVLVPNTDEDGVQSLCETIHSRFGEDSTQLIPLSMALGWATKTVPGAPLQPILREAENRMYHHKLMQGRGVRSAFISSLRRTLLEKAYETEEHSSRLEDLGVAVGKRLGLAQNQLDDLALLCMLHDIGKIGVPDEILKKPGQLTDDEWEVMRRHSEVGYRIANSSHELSHISYAILCHHERWDGTGYPLGLKATNIPLVSRIVAIADSFDAMTAGRAYCRSKTRDQAATELRRCAGTQFDPSLVDVAISILGGVEPDRQQHHHQVSVF